MSRGKEGLPTWLEISTRSLSHNVDMFRTAATVDGQCPLMCAMVKGNAYGHGLLVASQAFLEAGVDWLGIVDLAEARSLRQAGIEAPLYGVGYIPLEDLGEAIDLEVRMVVYGADAVDAAIAHVDRSGGPPARFHIKLETGTNRQGLHLQEAVSLARRIVASPGVVLEGVCTHFADIEDTTDHRFAKAQLERFSAGVAAIRAVLDEAGLQGTTMMAHASNTAAVTLWPRVCGSLIRFGIGAYGMWPSKETLVSARQMGRLPLQFETALTWKTRIAQVRDVPVGEYVGYGRTFRTVRPTRIAILPVGYYDGYDRGMSNIGQVLVGGQRAPVVGRVAMNMTAIDTTDSLDPEVGQEVVLLGRQTSADGQTSDEVSAAEIAGWLGTIHYEVVTRINDRLPRIAV